MTDEQTKADEQAEKKIQRKGSALDREMERARMAKAVKDERDEREIEWQHELTEKAREEFAATGGALLHQRQEEADRIMRLPSPEANKALGLKEGDPLKGPST